MTIFRIADLTVAKWYADSELSIGVLELADVKYKNISLVDAYIKIKERVPVMVRPMISTFISN